MCLLSSADDESSVTLNWLQQLDILSSEIERSQKQPQFFYCNIQEINLDLGLYISPFEDWI